MAVQKIGGWVIDAMNEELAQKCFNEVRELVQEHGVVALTKCWMHERQLTGLYARMRDYFHGGAAMAEKLMILDDYKAVAKQTLIRKRAERIPKWTKEYFDKVVRDDIMVKYGRIPLADTLVADGYSSLMAKVKEFYGTLEQLRAVHGCSALDRDIKKLGDLVKAHGVVALTCKWLRENGHSTMYNTLLKNDRDKIATELGVLDEYNKMVNSNRNKPTKWTKEYFDIKVKEVIAKFGGVPSPDTLWSQGYTALTGAIASKRYCSSYADLRKQYGVEDDKFTALNGMNLKSFAEVSFANFLYERGVTFKCGERYPASYEKMSGRSSGIYDFHIKTMVSDVVPAGEWVDVEIWGGPAGADKSRYAETRMLKERFHNGRPGFLGIECAKCYSVRALSSILKPYIGSPVVTEVINVKLVPLEERVVKKAQEIKAKLGGVFPNTAWFLHRGKYASREVYAWEDASWNPYLHLVYKVGGYSKLARTLIEREKRSDSK